MFLMVVKRGNEMLKKKTTNEVIAREVKMSSPR